MISQQLSPQRFRQVFSGSLEWGRRQLGLHKLGGGAYPEAQAAG